MKGVQTGSCRTFGAALSAFVAATMMLPAAFASTSVSMRADSREIAWDGTVTIEIVMEGEFDEARGPDMPDFKVVGRSSGSSVSIVNGTVSRQQRVTLALAPLREGELAIGKIELVREGRVVATSGALKIKVSGGGGQSPSPAGSPPVQPMPEDEPEPGAAQAADEPEAATASPPGSVGRGQVPAEMAGRQAFILPRVPDRPVYAGEPIYVEYALYTRSDVPLSGLALNSVPELKGFIIDNPSQDSESVRRVAIGGRRFEERIIWRAAVTAIDPGKKTFDPISIDLVTGGMFSSRRHKLASEPLDVTFAEVPLQGRPADFIPGTIGQYIVNSSLDKPIVKIGESAILTVEITGSGNLRALKPPRIVEPDGVRVDRVPSSDLDELRIDRGGISGRKVFQFLLTPEREGTFELGRIDVPFFSSLTGKYERARSDRIVLTGAGFAAGGKVMEARRDNPPLGIIGESDLKVPEPAVDDEINSGLLAAVMAAPVLFFGVAETLARRRAFLVANGRALRGRRALAAARAGLRRLRESNTGGQEFWTGLEGLIRVFLDARFGLNTQALTAQEIATALAAAGASPDDISSLAGELESCAFARFAPASALQGDRSAAIDRVERCLSGLDGSQGGEPG
ncbi:MAG TPA: BatD family protein [Myxococcota bacterium]|nr:BatD family protein [Myxococcota bacterium]HPV03798.1 BatD family protein [Myxococcota bacterium]